MNKPNYYILLGVSNQADLIEIKSAYRKLVKKFHPDKNENSQEHTDLFLQIQQAYEVLSHPTRRKKYDEQLFYAGLKSKSQQVFYDYDWLINQMQELQLHVTKLDEYSLNQAALSDYVFSLISLPQFGLIVSEIDESQRNIIHEKLLLILQKLKFQYLISLHARIRVIYINYENLTQEIESFYAIKKRQNQLRSLRPWLVLCIVILLCWMMVLYAKY